MKDISITRTLSAGQFLHKLESFDMTLVQLETVYILEKHANFFATLQKTFTQSQA